MLSLEPIFRMHVEVADTLPVGQTPYGERRVVPILGGRFEGPKLSGRILPGGADWQIIRSDGVAELRARYVIETDTGARVQVQSGGLRHGPREVLEAIARGDQVDPSRYYFRTVLRFEAADPSVAWLNRIIALGCGQREKLGSSSTYTKCSSHPSRRCDLERSETEQPFGIAADDRGYG